MDTAIYPPQVSAHTRVIVLHDGAGVRVTAKEMRSRLVQLGLTSDAVAHGNLGNYCLMMSQLPPAQRSSEAQRCLVIILDKSTAYEAMYLIGGLCARLDPAHLFVLTDLDPLLTSSMLASLTWPIAEMSRVVTEVAAQFQHKRHTP